MKPGAPWSVKGIKPEARETAKSAARRAGMTLGEWLNHTISETDLEVAPAADPIRAPEDWKRETGEELPWTRPIETLSAEVKARLAASENENTLLLNSLEVAISSISRKLIALDQDGQSGGALPTNLEARLVGVETRQKRALSKDHLKSLETAVGQISVVMDSQAARNEAARQEQSTHIEAQGTRIDQSQKAMVDLAAHLEQTEDRVNQALSSVEAAAELYDITDKQGQMIDSLVMDVAAVQAGQKTSQKGTGEKLTALSGDINDLRSEVKTLAEQTAEHDTNRTNELAAAQIVGVSEDARLAVEAIAAQISDNEERTASSVSLIEEQIVGLSQLLDQSLNLQKSGIEDLRSAVDTIMQRVDALEGTPREIAPGQTDTTQRPDLEEPEVPTEAPIETPDEAIVATPKPAVTFKTTPQQSAQSVNVNLAVNIDPDFVLTEPVIKLEDNIDEPLMNEPVTELSPDDHEAVDPDEPLPSETAPAEDIQQDHTEEPRLFDIEQDGPEIIPPAPSDTVASPEDAASWGTQVETAIDDHLSSVETLEDEPLSFTDIFGPREDNPVNQTLKGEGPGSETGGTAASDEGDTEEDAALREAVTNISTMRASWAARNEADGKPGSMRQIVDAGDEDGVKRSWAMTAGGLVVVLGAISGVLVYSGETSNLIDARQRPGLFDQMTSWMPGRSAKTFEGAAPNSNTVEETQASVILATIPAGLEEAARGGDARAQFALGRAFAGGDGRPVDKAAAVKWYEAAAGQGLAIAQYVLASLHERGIDVAQNKEVAMDWYAAAARGGNRRSMHNLAVAYARGDVIGQDLTQAAYWFAEAAALGLSDAQYNLALLHERGLGVDRDSVTALKWYQIAAAGGDESAQAQAARLSEKLSEAQKKIASDFVAAWQAKDMKPVANGLFDISPTAWDNAPRRTELATVQSRLLSLGYTIAGQDGIMDPVTRNAIKKFQSEHDLEVTGTLTPGLYESLTEPGVQ